jgi:hypothetical protein
MPASTILLKSIPKDLYKAIIQEQREIEDNTGYKKNQSQTIIKMLKDYLECKKNNNYKPKYT